MKVASTSRSLIILFAFGAFVGIGQTLTSTFQFTATGWVGTPATATTPFQGQNFTNATITITAVGNAANRQSCGNQPCYYLPSDSASISISGLGTFPFTYTLISNVVLVDPTKGVVGNSIYFGAFTSAPPPGVIPPSPVAAAISGSSGWNLLNSFGPVQTQINLTPFPMATSGGTLEFTSQGSVGTFQATFGGTPPPPLLTRMGVLSHIAAGGGWATVITLINNSSAPLPVVVALHNEDGSPMSLPLTTTLQGISQTSTTSTVNGTISPKATLLISTGNGIASTSVGCADVLSSGSIAGFAIFRQTPPNGSPSEGTVPLQIQFPSTITLPYDDTAGFVMGVALANLLPSSANITATVWDESGNQLGTQTIGIAGNGHSSFALPTQISLTSGKRGIVQFQSSGGIAGLGLRFSPFGTFTSVPTM